MIRKNIMRLGLVGVLLGTAGCATVQTVPVNYSGHIDGTPRIEGEKVEKVESVAYTIGSIVQDGSNLEVNVSEEKIEKKMRSGTSIVPVYDATYNRTETYDKIGVNSINFLAFVFGASAPFNKPNDGRLIERSEEKEISRKFAREERKPFQELLGEEIIYSNKPANVMLRVSSNDVGFGKEGLETKLFSSSEGIAKLQITKSPAGTCISDSDSHNKINEELKNGLTGLGMDSVYGSQIPLPYISYPITIETNSQANAGLLGRNIQFKDDKKVFNVKAKKPDFRFIYTKLEQIVKTDLEKDYLPRILRIRAFDEDTHVPIDSAVVKFRKVRGLSSDELIKGTGKTIGKYCIKDSIFYDYIVKNVDSSKLLADLDSKEIEIGAYGMELAVNMPSEYEIESVHPDYYSLSTVEKFPLNMEGTLDLYLSKVGEKVRIDSGKSRGRTVRR